VKTQAVLWDLGNVLLDWSPSYLYRKFFDDKAQLEAFLTHVCSMTWHAEHDRGVSMADNRVELIARYPQHAEAIQAWETRFPEMLNGTVAGTAEAMDELAARQVPQYALTNLPDEWLQPVLDLYPSMAHMRDIIVSAHEGVIKPDARIFEITANRLPHDPAEILFFDDRAENVEAARASGFDAEVFTDETALRAALSKRGLVQAPA
jgi:2-haloacid dehalogenase